MKSEKCSIGNLTMLGFLSFFSSLYLSFFPSCTDGAHQTEELIALHTAIGIEAPRGIFPYQRTALRSRIKIH